jgi:hypothetical protein
MEQTVPLAIQMGVDLRKMEFTIQTSKLLVPCLVFKIMAQILLMEITTQIMKIMKSSQFRSAQRILPKIDDQLHTL